MAKEQKEVKRNQLFGFIECTPGQNLVYVLLERKKGIHPFGILSSDLDEATEMIREVVAEEEFAILCKGFGLNGKERLFKYEIANEFGLTNHQLDKVVEKAFRKICKKKKADLMKLVPDLEELSEMKKKLRKLSAAKTRTKEMDSKRRRAEFANS